MKVACGVMYVDDYRLLMGLRSEHGKHPNYWEFPGGKCENDETIEECLHREWKEELNLTISIERRIYSWVGEENIECYFYIGKVLDLENIKMNVHQDIIYGKPEELIKLRLFEGDENILELLI